MTDAEFMRLVDEGVAALPENIQVLMDNVAVVVADDISPEKRKEMDIDGEVLFGLYEGVPRTERGAEYQALPDKITIFKDPVLRAYTNPKDIKECVENTIWHEVAHHFGYDDPWIEKEEIAREKLM